MLTIKRVQDVDGGSLRSASGKRWQDEADSLPAPRKGAPYGISSGHAAGTVAGCFNVTGSLADTSLRIRAAWASSVNPRAVS